MARRIAIAMKAFLSNNLPIQERFRLKLASSVSLLHILSQDSAEERAKRTVKTYLEAASLQNNFMIKFKKTLGSVIKLQRLIKSQKHWLNEKCAAVE